MRRSVVIAALAILVLLGCILVAGFYWGTGPSLRCEWPQRGSLQVDWSARTVVSGGREGCYLLYVPASYDPTRPAPLVVSLHGFLSNPESQAWISGWHKLADEEGFLVAYPQGTSWPQRWNAGTAWNAGADDVQFFRDLLDELASAGAVDRSRVYVNGLSNGGAMAVRIACQASDQVAAIGVVAAAAVDLQNCIPTHPVPLLAFHGTADPLVPYEGGDMRGRLLREAASLFRGATHFLGTEEWTARWAEDNGCAPEPESIPPQGDARGVQYTGCNQGADVILYTIEDGGHTWPGGMPIAIVGKTSEAIDATEEMWRFFQAYERDVGP